MVVFDTSFICLAFDKASSIPVDPATGQPIADCAKRIGLLIAQLSASKTQIVIPTPVLAEFLVRAGAQKGERLNILKTSKGFLIKPFDERSAIECSVLEDADLQSGKKLNEHETRAKVKFDRQILAIAKVNQVSTIYTGDYNLAQRAKDNDIKAIMTWEIPALPIKPQLELDYEQASQSKNPGKVVTMKNFKQKRKA